jgi:hypothetical protein
MILADGVNNFLVIYKLEEMKRWAIVKLKKIKSETALLLL